MFCDCGVMDPRYELESHFFLSVLMQWQAGHNFANENKGKEGESREVPPCFIDAKAHNHSFISKAGRLLTVDSISRTLSWVGWYSGFVNSACVQTWSENLPFMTSCKMQKVLELQLAEWVFNILWGDETQPVFFRAQKVTTLWGKTWTWKVLIWKVI